MIKQELISSAILTTVSERGADKSTCPSEVARMLFADNWRGQMEQVRNVAIDLAKQGKILITQKGLPINLGSIKGPIRIRIKQ